MKRFLLLIGLLSYVGTAAAGQDTIFALAARTASANSADISKVQESGIHVIINVTAVTTGTLTPTIQGEDFLGNYYDILVGSAISSTGITVLKIGPSIAGTANAAAQDIVPQLYRIKMTKSDSSSWTYSVTINKESLR